MTASLFFASDIAVVDVIVTRKTFKSQIFVSGNLEIFPKKSSPRQIIFISIKSILQEICCSFFEALSINESFQLNYQPNRKTVITTELLSFLSVEKLVHHFRLISFTGLNRHTDRPMIIIANLKKKASALRPLGLLS